MGAQLQATHICRLVFPKCHLNEWNLNEDWKLDWAERTIEKKKSKE